MLACLFLVPDAYSIEVGFSAENGGESVGISNDYQVSNGISIDEDAEATFGCMHEDGTSTNVEMTDRRDIVGTGDIHMHQTYSGSGSYNGMSEIYTEQTSSTGNSYAYLKPSILASSQSVDMTGDYAFSLLELWNKGHGAGTSAKMASGTLQTKQEMGTGSAWASQSAFIDAEWGKALSESATTDEQGDIILEEASASSELLKGVLDASQYARAGSACVWQETYIKGEEGVARSESHEYNEKGPLDSAYLLAAITEGSLGAYQYTEAISGVYGEQTTAFDSSKASLNAWAINHQAGGINPKNGAGCMVDGSGGVTGLAMQSSFADGTMSLSDQMLIAATGNDPGSSIEAGPEARWYLSDDYISRRGTIMHNFVTDPNSVLIQRSRAVNDNEFAFVDFDSLQNGNGFVSGLAGPYLAVPSGHPWFPGFSPQPGSVTLVHATDPGKLYYGFGIERSDELIRMLSLWEY